MEDDRIFFVYKNLNAEFANKQVRTHVMKTMSAKEDEKKKNPPILLDSIQCEFCSKPIKDIQCECGGKITQEMTCSRCGAKITEMSCPNCGKRTIFKPINWELIPEPIDEILEILTLDEQEEVLAIWNGNREIVIKIKDWPWGYHYDNKFEAGSLLLTYKRLIWVIVEEGTSGNRWHVGSSIPLENITEISTHGVVIKYISIKTLSEEYRFHLRSWIDNYEKLISHESFSPFIQEAMKMRASSTERKTSSHKQEEDTRKVSPLLEKDEAEQIAVSPKNIPKNEKVGTNTVQPTIDNSKTERTVPITVLFLASNPVGTTPLDLNMELNAIEDELDRCKFRDRFNLEQRFELTADDISYRLLKYEPQILHFSGHGSKVGEIILQDANGDPHPINALAIARLFKVLKDNIRCVVLNACYSEIQAMLISRYIDCVIGMSKAIGDEAATKFAQGFYRGLGFGKDLETAFKLGCAQINLQGLDEEDTPKIIWKNDEPKKIVLV